MTTRVEPGRPPVRGPDGPGSAGRFGAVGRWLAGRSDQAVFAACLAGIGLGIGLFLVVPLLGEFGPIHRLPTNLDYNVIGKPEGQVAGFWLLAMGSFGAVAAAAGGCAGVCDDAVLLLTNVSCSSSMGS